MHDKNIVIKTNDGNLDCKIFISDRNNNPNVIFYMDAPAIREELRDMCRKIADSGYNVILPNLFYRHGTEGNYPFDQNNYKKKKPELNKMLHTMNNTTNNMIIDDTSFILNYLHDNFLNKNIGIVGYCMSGRFVISCAASYPDEIKAVASFYGVDIISNKPDSAHLLANQIKGEIYLAFAEKDFWVPKHTLSRIKGFFSKIPAKTKIEVYPKTDHGFAFPNRSTYMEEAANKHWKELLNLFERTLKF